MPNKCCNTVWFPDRAELQQNIAPDGQPTPDYSGTPFKTNVPGRLINTSGDETFRGRQLEANVSHVYECRYFAGVTPTMRLKLTAGLFKNRIVNVEYVKVIREQGTPPKQWLYCTELAET